MTLSDHQWEFLQDQSLIVAYAKRRGWKLTGGELHRLPETQEILRKQGASKVSEGQHQKRLAIDLNLFIDGQYQRETEAYRELGEFWESLNPYNRWGGSWGWDGNHFERREYEEANDNYGI